MHSGSSRPLSPARCRRSRPRSSCRRQSRTGAIPGSGFAASGNGFACPCRGLPVAPSLTPSEPADAEPASVVTSEELISRSSFRPRLGSWLIVAVSGESWIVDSSLTRSAAPTSSAADGSHPPSASHALLAQMKLFLPASALLSGYGAASRHHVPMSTVAGGQVPASSVAVLPPTRARVAHRRNRRTAGICGSCRARGCRLRRACC